MTIECLLECTLLLKISVIPQVSGPNQTFDRQLHLCRHWIPSK